MPRYDTAPTNYSIIDMDVAKLQFAGGVLFGSRALNANTPASDYDFVILHSNLNLLLEHVAVDLAFGKLSQHFDCIPPYGNNYILKGLKFRDVKVDILIMEHQVHVDAIAKTTMYVRESASTLLLKDKDIRKALYLEGMLANGFIKNNIVSRIISAVKGLLWTPKNSKN